MIFLLLFFCGAQLSRLEPQEISLWHLTNGAPLFINWKNSDPLRYCEGWQKSMGDLFYLVMH